MKFHWGHGLAVFMAIFMIAVLGFVAYTFGFNNDLVVEKYYDAEIQYQKHIDKVDRTARLDRALSIELSDRGVEIRFPADHRSDRPSGTVTLYRPSDKRLDQQIPVGPDSSGFQLLPAQLLRPGVWRVKVEWTGGGRDFYSEKTVIVPMQ